MTVSAGRRDRLTFLGLLFALMYAPGAGAQQIASSLDDLKILENTNSRVTVTDTNGQKFNGMVVAASDTVLSLRIGSAIRRFAADEVQVVRVRKEDSLANGALIGAAVGGGLSSLMFFDNECRDDPVCYTALAAYAGMGALAGVVIDALIHRTMVVYSAPPPSAQRAYLVAPLIARGRNGVRLTIAF